MPILSSEFRAFLNRQQKFLVLQWLVCLASLYGYFPLSEVASKRAAGPWDSDYFDLVRYGLWVFAIGISFYLVWSRSRIHTVQAFLYALRQPIAIGNIRGSTSLEMQAHALFRIYQTRMFVIFFLCHIIALVGILLIIMGSDISDQHSAVAISAAVLIYYYPSRFFFDSLMKEYERREAARGWEQS